MTVPHGQKTSCIMRGENVHYVVLREDFLALCDGNIYAAALLSFFESWHNHKLKQQVVAHEANDVAELHGDPRTQDETLWQWHNEKELADGILIGGKTSIGKALDMLVTKRFLTINHNPNPRYKFDKTRFFLLHPETVNNALRNLILRQAENGLSIAENSSRQAISSSRQAENSSAISYSPILETNLKEESPYSPPMGDDTVMAPDSRENTLPEKNQLIITQTVPQEDSKLKTDGPCGVSVQEELIVNIPMNGTASRKARKPKAMMDADTRAVVSYLNEVTGAHFRTGPLITARLRAGYTVDECRMVIDWYKGVWCKKNPSALDYFDNETPFREGNFEKYRAKAEQWRATQTHAIEGDATQGNNVQSSVQQLLAKQEQRRHANGYHAY